MITILKADDRGLTEHDWLESRHSFSFGEFFDPERMGFRTLRVLNDDRVAPGKGFPMHGHRDMEIVSFVAKGEMQHEDSLGNGSVIQPGEVQRMTAGSGIKHSEWNPSTEKPLHLIQIWFLPRSQSLEPSYEQGAYDVEAARQNWVVLAAQNGGVVKIDQDAVLAVTQTRTGEKRSLEYDPGRAGYLFVVSGSIRFHGNELAKGDAAKVEDESRLEFESLMDSQILAFDLA
ncbi:MAG TPA: pirin family protein [Fimbriimonadaceae bacterium]|nr:pirin family protein [Fimbriimonadaceae bacterium]